MTNITFTAGTVIYEGMREEVRSLDIIAKGTVRATGDYCTIDLPTGSVIGIGEFPGEKYIFTYIIYHNTKIKEILLQYFLYFITLLFISLVNSLDFNSLAFISNNILKNGIRFLLAYISFLRNSIIILESLYSF